MSDPMIGEIRLFPYGWPPYAWHLCDGSLLAISQYTALYAILGTRYGGNGTTNFQLPDLRARVAVGYGDDPSDIFDPAIGASGGLETVTLTSLQVPPHTHPLVAAMIPAVRTQVATPIDNWIGQELLIRQPKGNEFCNAFAATAPTVALNTATLSPYMGTGGAHENRQPYQVMGYYIALTGDYFPNPN